MDAITPVVDLSKIPLAQNPNGDPPNFINPPSNRTMFLAVGVALLSITALFVVLRLVTNLKIVRKLFLDDYLCLVAYILMTALFGLIGSRRSAFRHTWDVPVSFITESYIKKAFALNFIIGPAIWSSKAAILSLYLRLFTPMRWFRITSYTALLVTFLFYWANTSVAGVLCSPRPGKPWDAAVLKKCYTLAVPYIVQGAVGTAADIVILVLPLPSVFSLNLAPRRKLGLAAVFLAGIFAINASAVSLYYRVVLYFGEDNSWNSAYLYTAIFAECYVTIMVSCAPAVSAFWVNIFINSTFYCGLRSGRRVFWARRPISTTTGNTSYAERPIAHSQLSTDTRFGHDGDHCSELHDTEYPRTM